MKLIKHTISFLILTSLILLIFSYFKKNNLPEKNLIVDSLSQAPSQTSLEPLDKPFKIEKGGNLYTLTPLYKYELYGLSVADYDSENWLDVAHKKDPLNTKDICAIWGDNIAKGIYQNLKFTHGEFTCFANAKDDKTWNLFRSNEISNSHLIPSDERVYKKIKEAQVGDQIYFKGYLVNYEYTDADGNKYSRNSNYLNLTEGNSSPEQVQGSPCQEAL